MFILEHSISMTCLSLRKSTTRLKLKLKPLAKTSSISKVAMARDTYATPLDRCPPR